MDEKLIDQVFSHVERLGYGDELPRSLREGFPALHFTFCLDDDIYSREPIRSGQHANLYLVSKGEHCLSFTNDQGSATGLVVAEVIDF